MNFSAPENHSLGVRTRFRMRIDRILSRLRGESAAGSGGSPELVIVAASGGGDSTALVRLFHEFSSEVGIHLVLAHFQHGRDAHDAIAREFVMGLAARLGLECEIGGPPENPPQRASETLEREIRLAWLRATAARRSAALIALGHTRDDQIETILFRILRGTGLKGLSGIPEVRRWGDSLLIHPLLFIGRASLRRYLHAIGETHVEDPENALQGRMRSDLRGTLLPLIERSFNPRAGAALLRLGRQAGAANREIERRAERTAAAALVSITDAEALISRAPLERLRHFSRAEALRIIWRKAGWGERHMSANRWSRLARWVIHPVPRRFAVGAGVEAILDGRRIRLTRVSLPSRDRGNA